MTDSFNVKIRPVTASDDVYLAPIIRGALIEFNANKPGTVYFEDSTNHLSKLFSIPRAAYFVVHEGDTVAGGAGIYPTEGLADDTCELAKMYLAPPFRKMGYGNLLMNRCIEEARAFDYKYLYLETMPELKAAIAFYRKTGFYHLDAPMGNSGHTGCDVWMRMEL